MSTNKTQSIIPPPTSFPCCAKVLSAFDASTPEFLNIEVGDVVIIHRETEDGHLECSLHGKRGRFPRYKLESLAHLHELAEANDAAAQRELGVRYDFGYGVAIDSATALTWFRKAAELGNARAKLNVGWYYENGCVLEKDLAEAARWCQEAAELGDIDGQFHVGVCYDEGMGVQQDHAEAAMWYRKAAERGSYFLAQCVGCFRHHSHPTFVAFLSFL